MTHCALRVVALLGVTLAGCAAPPPPEALTAGPKTETIYLIERGWHTDIGISADQIDPSLAALRTALPGVRVLLIGFGERAYLLRRDHDFGDMLAALVPGPGALLVTGLRDPPQVAFPPGDVVKLRVSARGLAELNGFFARSFERTPDGAPREIGAGPYAGSLFYAATVTYSGTFTCNTWTAEGLQTAGLPIHADGVLFADGVADQARRIAGGPE
ncbi:MAG TPA: DUF2459 domain-containing protein [Acetobacteraceae bacterium]|jgi:uncharacterized protein (TIGR02117 family)|nr:DUF2459 domain-containing protein [Acetobacteraceae bacterium]